MAANRNYRHHTRSLDVRFALILLCVLLADESRAAERTYTFSSPPDSVNAQTGAFVYETPGGPSATFVGFEHTPGPGFYDYDHTGDDAGLVYGLGAGPAVISFSTPVQLVEMFVGNLYGDFDDRQLDPFAHKLFVIKAESGGATAFTYDRATESGAGNGLAAGYLRIAPAAPVTIDSLSFSSFNEDVMDDLRIQFVPEPGGVVLVIGATAVLHLARRHRRMTTPAGHAPPLNVTYRAEGCS